LRKQQIILGDYVFAAPGALHNYQHFSLPLNKSIA